MYRGRYNSGCTKSLSGGLLDGASREKRAFIRVEIMLVVLLGMTWGIITIVA